MGAATLWMHKDIEGEPLIPCFHSPLRTAAFLGPDITHDRKQADPMFVKGP